MASSVMQGRVLQNQSLEYYQSLDPGQVREMAFRGAYHDEVSVLRFVQQTYGLRQDMVDEKGNNLLHWAAQFSPTGDTIRFLVKECGFNTEVENADGSTPIYLATCINAQPMATRALIACGANVNHHHQTGDTSPLANASAPSDAGLPNANPANLLALIEAGADVHFTSKDMPEYTIFMAVQGVSKFHDRDLWNAFLARGAVGIPGITFENAGTGPGFYFYDQQP